ncbi:DNA cytosine methyltransferase [Prevotella sp.]|nr:DNA cytosine methyltransferase [Prevotella sp.]MCF2579380.1 DNA cytosine methyltransferase [Leyella stercorea]
MKMMYKFVDLFAGCGGLSLGLQQAGFSPWFVNEIVEQFCNTYKFNHNLSDEHYFVGDIAELNLHLDEYKEILSDITLVCGGPPCQGFSMANRQRILDDPRNSLYKQYLIFLKNVRPKFFVMENVKGMMNKIEEIKQNFKEYLGEEYQFDYALFKAQDYGVPQNRERFIMIGNRVGVSPHLIFEEIYKHKRKPFVLKDALEGLPHLIAKKEKGSKGIECAESGFTECDFTYIHNDFYKFINGDREITKLYNHKNRYNNERDIEIYRRLPQGANSLHESIADIMPYKRRNDIFKDKYFKLDETQICKTITSHMKFDCNMYIHPWDARGLSPREAARIQTFPDDYVITGSQNMWYAQVGNAVPVKLAKAIGDGIMKFMK